MTTAIQYFPPAGELWLIYTMVRLSVRARQEVGCNALSHQRFGCTLDYVNHCFSLRMYIATTIKTDSSHAEFCPNLDPATCCGGTPVWKFTIGSPQSYWKGMQLRKENSACVRFDDSSPSINLEASVELRCESSGAPHDVLPRKQDVGSIKASVLKMGVGKLQMEGTTEK